MSSFSVKVSPSLYRDIENLKEEIEVLTKQHIVDIAETLANKSMVTVDTGAYIESHSVSSDTMNNSRSVSSKGKPRRQNPATAAGKSLANMVSDINRIDFENTTIITFSNEAPHAYLVENGWPTKGGYGIYAQLRNLYG